jgi:site-specific DNA-methyltransferase (adenine-specific)
MNKLYYGDNLDILRRYINDETIDLIYLDPPFNSKATYNVLFGNKDEPDASAQIQAFEDTWHWDHTAAESFREVVESGGDLSRAMQAFRLILNDSDMLAYLSMMAPRLVELRRVLKNTGSIYLHCDPTASHYLKILMDSVFGAKNFRNDISWCYRERERDIGKYNPKHDCILFYVKDVKSEYTFNHDEGRTRYSPGSIKKFNYRDNNGRRFQIRGRNVAGSPYAKNQGLSIELETTDPDLVYRDYLDKASGVAPRDWLAPPMGNPICPKCSEEFSDNLLYFADQEEPSRFPMAPLNRVAAERLGYPTQKPESLLEYFIKISSNQNDIVLDPFCGCGTTVAVSQRLNRNWIGIDITHLAINLMKHRLHNTFGDSVEYDVIGEPVSLEGANALAKQDPYQFQWWALGLVSARPNEQKKGADAGIDGRIYFHDEANGDTKQVIISVKAGKSHLSYMRDLRGVVDREDAEIGVLITMQEPTQPMKAEAASGGFYESPGWGERYPKLQILTIEELLDGKGIEMPPIGQVNVTFKKAPKSNRDSASQPGLVLVD